MQGVREYVFSLMVVSLSCGFIELLLPDKAKVSKYVHFTAALIISTVILSPLHSVFGVLPEILDVHNEPEALEDETGRVDYTELIIEESVEKIKNELKDQIEGKLKCEISEIDLLYNADDVDNIVITVVRIGYEEYNKYLFSDTVNYTKELMKCDCEVYSVDK